MGTFEICATYYITVTTETLMLQLNLFPVQHPIVTRPPSVVFLVATDLPSFPPTI